MITLVSSQKSPAPNIFAPSLNLPPKSKVDSYTTVITLKYCPQEKAVYVFRRKCVAMGALLATQFVTYIGLSRPTLG